MRIEINNSLFTKGKKIHKNTLWEKNHIILILESALKLQLSGLMFSGRNREN